MVPLLVLLPVRMVLEVGHHLSVLPVINFTLRWVEGEAVRLVNGTFPFPPALAVVVVLAVSVVAEEPPVVLVLRVSVVSVNKVLLMVVIRRLLLEEAEVI